MVLMIPHFKKVYSQDYEINKVQSNVEDTFNYVTSSAFMNGIFLPVTINTTDTVIQHLLNRTYQGWLITNINIPAIVYQSPTVNNNKDRQIILIASIQANVTLYIF
jgi:5-methylcytosine-specific restriction endonuclease McrBC GTP-binding regulatory subunit McrB